MTPGLAIRAFDVMYDITAFYVCKSNQIRQQATRKMLCQPGDYSWSSSSGVCVGIYIHVSLNILTLSPLRVLLLSMTSKISILWTSNDKVYSASTKNFRGKRI